VGAAAGPATWGQKAKKLAIGGGLSLGGFVARDTAFTPVANMAENTMAGRSPFAGDPVEAAQAEADAAAAGPDAASASGTAGADPAAVPAHVAGFQAGQQALSQLTPEAVATQVATPEGKAQLESTVKESITKMLPALEVSTGMKGPEILNNFMKEGPEKAMQRAAASTNPDEMAKQLQAVGYDTSKAQDPADLTTMFGDFFGKMDQPSQLAVSLGIPLAVVGLISSFMGGGGMMSMLAMLLGGGAAALGGTGMLTQTDGRRGAGSSRSRRAARGCTSGCGAN